MADEVVSSVDQNGNPLFQAQSDWAQTNTKSASYIKNKPAIVPQVQADMAVTDNTSPAYVKNKTGGAFTQQNADWNSNSGVTQILNKPSFVPSVTGMASSNALGLLTDGTDQTAALNTAFLNSNYAGIVMDFSPVATVTINGAVNCQGKVLKFIPGNTIKGTYTFTNFILDTGLKQKCFDIGTSGAPTGTIAPNGTTLSVISPWVFGAKDDNSDCARAFQATIDTCIKNGSKVSKIIIPTGTYVCNSPLIEYSWNGSIYANHQITIEGETNFSEASGFGTVIDFSARRNSFGFGIQSGKGSAIKNIKCIGGFVPPSISTNYGFYTGSIGGFTDGVSRDTQYSPNLAIAIDPFGSSTPSDGGYPGNDAYGNALSGYYRGSTNGSTGVIVDNVFAYGWVVGLATSVNGTTVNGELVRATNLQFANYKWCISGCQTQEKDNVVEHFQAWGEGYGIFCNNLYGTQAAGSWSIRDFNVAGFNVVFGSYNDSGYLASDFGPGFCESIGGTGSMKSDQGATFNNVKWNLVPYTNFGAYNTSQINTPGFTHNGGSIKMYGTFKPISIYGVIGPIYFHGVSFETVPFMTTGYARGNSSYKNCFVGGDVLNPDDLQTVTSFSDTFAYGFNKINSSGRTYNISWSYPAMPLPIIRTNTNYVVTITLTSGFYQSVITLGADELSSNRVQVGDLIVASTTAGGQLSVLGLVTAAGGGSMTVKYINNSAFTSGSSYYLYVWLPLYNLAFTGDFSNGVAQINNVSVNDGNVTSLINTGGLFYTSKIPVTDFFSSNLLRFITFTSGTIAIDKAPTSTLVGNLLIQADGTVDQKANILAVGQVALTSGTKAITISGVRTTSRAFITLVSQNGTTTTTQSYEAVCTQNTLTLNAVTNAGTNTVNASDTSTLNYFVIQ